MVATGLDDKLGLSDSRVIVQAIELRRPTPPLLPSDPKQRIEAMALEAMADGICDAAALFTQEGWRRPESRSDVWRARQRRKVEAGLQAPEPAIGRWLPDPAADGKPLGLVPSAVGSALGFVSFLLPDLAWRLLHPTLVEMAARLEAYADWAPTAPHLPPGAAFPNM